MFSLKTNTSKFCLLYLLAILKKNNFSILDSQFFNPHLVQFGAYEIETEIYENKLKVMDMTAFTLCQENKLPIIVFNINKKQRIKTPLDGSFAKVWIEFKIPDLTKNVPLILNEKVVIDKITAQE